MRTSDPFAVVPGVANGLSLDDLFRVCPLEYKQLDNGWRALARNIRLHRGVCTNEWKFRSKENKTWAQQVGCLMTILSASVITSTNETPFKQDSIVAWMLHEMLEELPAFVPAAAL